ncbi:MAG: 4Fe-4S binding protein [Chloroflexota bacterium]
MSSAAISDVPKAVWVVDATKCNACGNCAAICPVKALVIGKTSTMSDEPSCCRASCRICERQCPRNAITAY